MLVGKSYTGPEVDVWSCGAVLYYMLSGDVPFQAINDLEVIMNIRKARLKPLDKKQVSRAARNIVRRMLEPNPLKRITMRDVLDHDWFQFDKSTGRDYYYYYTSFI